MPEIKAAAVAESATTISGKLKYDSTKAVTVPTTAVTIFPVL